METHETLRIKETYRRRRERLSPRLYSLFSPGNLFMVQRREFELLNVFRANGITSLEGMKILDLGCGTGMEMKNLIRYGARPEDLYGLDLLPERIEEARRISPNISFKCANAETLPYPAGFFDMVVQFTVFTSILDSGMKKNIASEMLRVLKTGGIIVWYDYHVNNPRNPDVRGVNREEIGLLFPGCGIYLRRITLAPPLTRRLAPHSWLLCHFLEGLKFLNTHYIGAIRKGSPFQ